MTTALWIPVICCAASFYLYMLSVNLPTLSANTSANSTNATQSVSFPTSLDDLRDLSALLTKYRDEHIVYVIILFCSAYLYKQTFAIPGSVFMNLLAGALFGVSAGFPLTCVLTAIGATNCYMLSRFFGKSYIVEYFPRKIALLHSKIEQNADGLFFFLLFLRLFPMSPNWFLNMVSPILNIPAHIFFFSVLLGLMPYNFICVETGCMLADISSIADVVTWSSCGKLAAMATVSLIPSIIFRRRRRQSSQKKLH